jgi:T5SS/PEP-CTERM-associated repeat protein
MRHVFAQCVARAARSVWFVLALVASFFIAGPLASARADITPTGDVSPTDPSTWTSSTTGYIGNTSAGTLTVDGGSGLLSGNSYIGYGATATGVVSVMGTASTWSPWDLYVGAYGGGTLSIADGGSVSNSSGYIGCYSGSMGLVTVDGAGSRWSYGVLCVGQSGIGTLSITNGGSVNCPTDVFTSDIIGRDSGSTGRVMVDGAGSTWNSGDLAIGGGGGGTLSITSGGSVSFGSSVVGDSPGSTGVVTVDGSGSTWANGNWTSLDTLIVGRSGAGTLLIANGGSVDCTTGNNPNTYVGRNSGSTGKVTVDGIGSTWKNANLYLGYNGSGALSITNGGSVTVAHATYVGRNTGSSGLIDFGTNGGTLTTDALLASPSQLRGTGTINACGLVSDVNLVFDSTHGAKQTLLFQGPNQNVTINLDASAFSQNYSNALGAGWRSSGSLTVQDGITVKSCYGYLGYASYSTGVATVTGVGSKWDTGGPYVGVYGSGTLSITAGGSVTGGSGNIGYYSGSTGVTNVDGNGSTWTNNGDLRIGNSGSGRLSITNGGSVSVAGTTCIGYNTGSTGAIDFGPNGGTLTTKTLCFSSLAQLSGTGTINACGLISNINLVFDSTHGVQQAIAFQQSGQSITLNLDMATSPSNNGDFGAGWQGAGSLTIRDGMRVDCYNAYLGYHTGSSGVASVTGSGSTWNVTNNYLYVGYYGSGALSIANGGSVTCGQCFLAHWGSATGVVSIDGTGSSLTSRSIDVAGGTLSITNGGHVSSYYSCSTGRLAAVNGTGSVWNTDGGKMSIGGTLVIAGGGVVTAKSAAVSSASLLAVDVGQNSLVTVGSGTGTITNNGTVRIVAGAGVPVDDNTKYKPIAAGTWGGTGTCQPIGGTWDATGHLFTASSIASGTSGSPVGVDRALVQRVLISDEGTERTGWSVGASFPAAEATGTATMTFTASAISEMTLGGKEVLGGWTFATTGYEVTASNPIYLSFDVGAGHPADGLRLWHCDGSDWATFSPFDLTYDGKYASFTVTGLSGYAVTVPEPGTVGLLAVGVVGLIVYARRRRR